MWDCEICKKFSCFEKGEKASHEAVCKNPTAYFTNKVRYFDEQINVLNQEQADLEKGINLLCKQPTYNSQKRTHSGNNLQM